MRGHQHAKDESIQVPHKRQPPKTLHSHPQDHAFSTRSQTTNIFSTLRNKHIQHWFDGSHGSDKPKSRKSLRQDLCHCGLSPRNKDNDRLLLHFTFTRLKQYKGLEASLGLICLLMNVDVTFTPKTKLRRFTPLHHGQDVTHFLSSLCKPSHATLQLAAVIQETKVL